MSNDISPIDVWKIVYEEPPMRGMCGVTIICDSLEAAIETFREEYGTCRIKKINDQLYRDDNGVLTPIEKRR